MFNKREEWLVFVIFLICDYHVNTVGNVSRSVMTAKVAAASVLVYVCATLDFRTFANYRCVSLSAASLVWMQIVLHRRLAPVGRAINATINLWPIPASPFAEKTVRTASANHPNNVYAIKVTNVTTPCRSANQTASILVKTADALLPMFATVMPVICWALTSRIAVSPYVAMAARTEYA